MKSYSCFTSIIDLMSPGIRLLSYPEIILQFNAEFTKRMGESALKYGGKLLNRTGKGFLHT